MNSIIRFGHWWESRRKVTLKEFQEFKDSQRVPSAEIKEIALIKARLDRLELLTGLKRDPQPAQVPGAAKIS
jgi:hypothetical protein